jgi:ribosomal protein S18 acetylase RimI-like enzyme
MIRGATAQDITEIVTVHLESFEGFFLTFLGRDFLAVLYESLLTDRDGILLVCEENQHIAGFVAGTTCLPESYRRMLGRRALAFWWAATGALLRRPAIAPRLFRALRRPSEAMRYSAEAVLMSIAVRPEDQGRGVGQALVRAFGTALEERGVDVFCLTTDRDGNDRVHRFYAKLGLRPVTEHVTPEGRAMTEYCLNPED